MAGSEAGPRARARPGFPPSARCGDAGGVGWYPPNFFRALRKAGLEPAPGCVDWDAWFVTYRETFAALRDEGLTPRKVVIDPGELARWLSREAREHAIAAHADFVAWRLERLLDEASAVDA